METGNETQVIVIAEAPVPGLVKTGLTPPLRPEEAALVAEAALADTLDVVAATPAARRVIALDGAPGAWLPRGFEVIGQRGGGPDERLAAAFADAHAALPLPMVLIGTRHSAGDRRHARRRGRLAGIRRGGRGLRPGDQWRFLAARPPPAGPVAAGRGSDVPPDPGRVLLERLAGDGLRVALAPRLTPVGTFDAAEQVAGEIPASRFAAAFSAAASGLSAA